MASLNEVRLIGNLGRDAETRFMPNGDAKTSFSVATSKRWQDKISKEWKEATTWHNVTVWRKDKLAAHLLKGTQVFVAGSLDTRSFEDKDGNKRTITEVVADQVLLLSKSEGKAASSTEITDDDVPF